MSDPGPPGPPPDPGPPFAPLPASLAAAAAAPFTLEDAVARALAAAAVATDAAHEAEAAIAARGAAAEAMRATARRTGMLAMLVGGGATAVLALAAGVWLKSAADLRAASEAQNAAGLAFVAQLVRLDEQIDRLEGGGEGGIAAELMTRVDALKAQHQTNSVALQRALADLQVPQEAMPAADPAALAEAQTAKVLAAIADVQLALVRLQAGDAPATAPTTGGNLTAVVAQLVAVTDRLDRLSRATSTPPAAEPKSAERPASRPNPDGTTRPARPPAPNPFKFP